jgi:hypothetical protein
VPKATIPVEIQAKVKTIVSEFNRTHFSSPERSYLARFHGRFLYLDRCDLGEPFQICRLTYQGRLDDWEFSIYRHSKGRYDPDEGLFPGDQYVDGTIQGAMKAGLEAYPVVKDTLQRKILHMLFRTFFRR